MVEINAEEGAECMASCVATHLRIVADQIENGIKGDNYLLERPSNGQKTEVLWEHESKNYGGFRILSDKPLIRQFIYGSEPKPEKYVIIVHNYDQDNSGSYPMDNKLFASIEEAYHHLRDNIQRLKNNHWTANRVDGEDHYSEEFTVTGWEAEDSFDGESLEATIYYLNE